jgi:hypothetical protein
MQAQMRPRLSDPALQRSHDGLGATLGGARSTPCSHHDVWNVTKLCAAKSAAPFGPKFAAKLWLSLSFLSCLVIRVKLRLTLPSLGSHFQLLPECLLISVAGRLRTKSQ